MRLGFNFVNGLLDTQGRAAAVQAAHYIANLFTSDTGGAKERCERTKMNVEKLEIQL